MKKIIKYLVLTFIIIVCSHSSIARADTTKVNDMADLFSDSEEATLTDNINEIIEKYNIDMVIVTTDDLDGKTDSAYADDYYDDNGYGYDDKNSGVLLLIDMENREVYISTTGTMMDVYSDSRVDEALDEIYDEVSDGNYYDGANKFISISTTYIMDANGYNPKKLFIAIVLALVISGIVCLGIINKYKNGKSQSGLVYIKSNSINFLRRQDRFVTSHVSRHKIQNNNGGSSHSSTHVSSSGRSHGGGGRHF